MIWWAHSKQSEIISLGPFVYIHAGFAAPVGPFKAVGNVLSRKLLGPFINIDASFVFCCKPFKIIVTIL
jgi:hypothetical protein